VSNFLTRKGDQEHGAKGTKAAIQQKLRAGTWHPGDSWSSGPTCGPTGAVNRLIGCIAGEGREAKSGAGGQALQGLLAERVWRVSLLGVLQVLDVMRFLVFWRL